MTYPATIAERSLTVFATPEGEAEVQEAYQRVLDHWPVAYADTIVPTSFGDTQVFVSGPEAGQPVVLLHALLATAMSWYRTVEPLSAAYRVYAVDIIGEGNRSRPTRPIRSLDDFAQWFTELIDGLGIESCYVVGNSYGGLTGATYAMKLPERVRKLVLIGPAATVHRMAPFYLHMFIPKAAYLMIPHLPGLAGTMRRSVDWMHAGLPEDPLWGPLFYRSMMHGGLTNQVFPRVYRREEFDQIKAPVLLILGGRERIYNPQRAARAAERLIRGVQVEIVPEAHHITALAQPDAVNARLLQFFRQA